MGTVTRWDHVLKRLRWGEDTLAIVILFVMTMLPFLASITRVLNISSIPASQVLVQHCTLWIGFLGAVLAARRNKLLALTREPLFKKEEEFHFGKWIAKVTTFLVLVALSWGSWQLVKVEIQYPIDIAPNIPRWFAQFIMPLCFGLMAIQVYSNSYVKPMHRLTLIIIGLIFSISAIPEMIFDVLPAVPIGILIIIIAVVGFILSFFL